MLWMIVCSYHVTYSFHCESTFHSCLNVKELLAQSRRHIWRLIDCNGSRLTSFAKWLSDRSQTTWLWVQVPLQSLRLLLLRKFWVLCFLVTIIFFEIRPFTILPTNKSSCFQNNTWCSLWGFWERSITNKPHISTVFLTLFTCLLS